MAETGVINIRGKEYQTVALRVSKFREAYPTHSLTTAIVEFNADCVIMQAQVADETGAIKATGHAEEYRASSQINKTSALENCETSAIGRALALFGFGGSEFASANEVVNAIHQQNTPANDANERINNPVPHPKQPRAEKWEGAYSGVSALRAGMSVIDRNIRGCGDSNELAGYLETPEYKQFAASCEKYHPLYLTGGDPAPPEFVGINDLVAKMQADFDLIENNTLRAG